VQHLPRETKLRDIWGADLTIGTATRLSRERLWTVADGCGRLRAVAQRLANTAATPKLQNETGTLVTHSGIIGDKLRYYKNKTWVEVPKPSLSRYKKQVHSSTKTTQ
jgi:hypothetical protein